MSVKRKVTVPLGSAGRAGGWLAPSRMGDTTSPGRCRPRVACFHRARSASSSCNASTSRSRVSCCGARVSPRSRALIVSTLIPARSARASWLSPASRRARRSSVLKVGVGSGLMTILLHQNTRGSSTTPPDPTQDHHSRTAPARQELTGHLPGHPTDSRWSACPAPGILDVRTTPERGDQEGPCGAAQGCSRRPPERKEASHVERPLIRYELVKAEQRARWQEAARARKARAATHDQAGRVEPVRSEEHTSELQSH